MKRNELYILRKFAGESMLVPTGTATQDFNGMFTLNETAAFIWEHIEEVENIDKLVEMMIERYEVEPEEVKKDIQTLLDEMISSGMVSL